MITLYSGTPGSGKSYHTAYKMYHGLRFKRNFICNFDISLENTSLTVMSYWKKVICEKLKIKCKKLHYKKLGKFIYLRNDQLTPGYLLKYAQENHSMKKESETTIVIDECQMLFNSRDWNAKDRMQWIEFFSVHRHYGFDVILISQSDRLIDRQIRAFVEYDIKHRKLNNYKLFGLILGILSGGCLFGAVKYWYGVREKVDFEMLRYNKRVASIYDTFLKFLDDESIVEDVAPDLDKGCAERGVPLASSGTTSVPVDNTTEEKSESWRLSDSQLKELFSR